MAVFKLIYFGCPYVIVSPLTYDTILILSTVPIKMTAKWSLIGGVFNSTTALCIHLFLIHYNRNHYSHAYNLLISLDGSLEKRYFDFVGQVNSPRLSLEKNFSSFIVSSSAVDDFVRERKQRITRLFDRPDRNSEEFVYEKRGGGTQKILV